MRFSGSRSPGGRFWPQAAASKMPKTRWTPPGIPAVHSRVSVPKIFGPSALYFIHLRGSRRPFVGRNTRHISTACVSSEPMECSLPDIGYCQVRCHARPIINILNLRWTCVNSPLMSDNVLPMFIGSEGRLTFMDEFYVQAKGLDALVPQKTLNRIIEHNPSSILAS